MTQGKERLSMTVANRMSIEDYERLHSEGTFDGPNQ